MSRPRHAARSGERDVRFAILCPEGGLPRWQATCVERVREIEGVELVAATAVAGAPGPPSAPFLYRHCSERLARTAPLRTVPLDRIVNELSPLRGRCETSDGGCRLVLSDAAVKALQDRDLDFLLSLGLPSLAGSHLALPRHGTWAYDLDLLGGAPLWGIRALLRRQGTVTARLLRMADGSDDEKILLEGRFRTDAGHAFRSATRPLDEIGTWPARACRALRRRGSLPSAGPVGTVPQNSLSLPSNIQMLGLGLRVLRDRLAVAWGRLFRHPQWNIGVVDQPIEAFLCDGPSPSVEWYPLMGRESFLADPFGIEEGDEATVLCERFDYDTGRGSICRLQDDEGRLRPEPAPALEMSVHASYPCLVREEGEIYCVPETRAAGETALFRATQFPSEWERMVPLLPDVAGVDPTVFRHGGRWWLACTEEGCFPDARLLLFHAERLEGPWSPHADNPVKTDVTSARPGGTPFEHGGELYRPAQDCSRTYGGRIVINRVERLTTEEFREEPVASVRPGPGSPYPAGRHTLSAFGDRTLIDGHRFVFVWAALKGFLRIWSGDLLGGPDGAGAPPAAPSDATDRFGETTPEGG